MVPIVVGIGPLKELPVMSIVLSCEHSMIEVGNASAVFGVRVRQLQTWLPLYLKSLYHEEGCYLAYKAKGPRAGWTGMCHLQSRFPSAKNTHSVR